MILAGDVGGTKTALALFDMQGVSFTLVREDRLPSRDFPTFEAAVARFLGKRAERHDRRGQLRDRGCRRRRPCRRHKLAVEDRRAGLERAIRRSACG